MTFGLEYGQVVDRSTCPRCGAPAVERARLRPSGYWETHLVCNKCHRVHFTTLSSPEMIAARRNLANLQEKLAKAKTMRSIERIEGKIFQLKEEMKLYELARYAD